MGEILDLNGRLPIDDELSSVETPLGCGCICYVESGDNNIDVVAHIMAGT